MDIVNKKDFLYLVEAFYMCKQDYKEDLVFLHVGSFTGKLEKKLTSLFPYCKIYSFEPHPDNFKRLEENTKHLDTVVRINKAIITNEFQDEVLLQGKGSVATTYQVSSGIKVPATTLKKVTNENNIQKIDAIFYNAEGSEMEFLPYIIENNLYTNISQICLNFHVHVPEFNITYSKVEKLLESLKIKDYYHINDDRITKIASKATGKQLSEKYPCFLFSSRD